MKATDITLMLEKAGVRPTPNRELVLRELLDADRPLSMSDLEERLLTVEKSSIHSVLSVLVDHDLIHALEDGRGIAHYEPCGGHGSHTAADMHAHFYCERCEKTFCLDDIDVPRPFLPQGFELRSLNYMLKGLCPECSGK